MTDPLSRLRAGLAEDERIARAAFTNHATGADRWRADGMQVWNEAATSTLVVGHTWPREARHIARQCPKATLDRVEAIRKVIADYERRLPSADDPALEDAEYRASWMGYRVAGELFLRALASIYPEPTETGEPQ